MDFVRDFGPFRGRAWINCAHQGALPRKAAKEAKEAINWKISPHELTTDRFSSVPARLKSALGTLLGTSPDEIVLANSASYGLHLLANGIPWREGDEILLIDGDFPSDILPWLRLQDHGVSIRFLKSRDPLPESDELQSAITKRTRLFCTTWVHSFSGYKADIEKLARVCRDNKVISVINASQALGAVPLNVQKIPVDAVTCVGFKWLCGPYGTGFCWISPSLLQSLEYNQAYWLSEMTADDLGNDNLKVELPEGPRTAKTYDVFGTANFLNFKPWAAAIEYLLEQGIERIAEYDQTLVEHLITGIDRSQYVISSPLSGPSRSTLVFMSHQDPTRNDKIYEKLNRSRVNVAYRKGKIRLSPHLYNTNTDIEKALSVLNKE